MTDRPTGTNGRADRRRHPLTESPTIVKFSKELRLEIFTIERIGLEYEGRPSGTAKFEVPSVADCVSFPTAEMTKMTVVTAAGLTVK